MKQMALFVNTGVIVNSFPILGECLTNYVTLQCVAVGQPWPVRCSVTRVGRSSAHVTSYFVVTSLVDSIKQTVLIIWDLL